MHKYDKDIKDWPLLLFSEFITFSNPSYFEIQIFEDILTNSTQRCIVKGNYSSAMQVCIWLMFYFGVLILTKPFSPKSI